MLRHEQQTVRATYGGQEEEYDAPRRQKPPTPQPELFKLFEEEPSGVPRKQERVQRHTVEQLADVAPMVPSLAVPESLMWTSWWPY